MGLKTYSKFTLFSLVIVVFSGCASSLPPMSDPQSYKSMDCAELQKEKAAVDANKQAKEENSKFGAAEILTIMHAGMGAYAGDTSSVSLAQQNMDLLGDTREESAESAESFGRRSEILAQVSAIRKCQSH